MLLRFYESRLKNIKTSLALLHILTTDVNLSLLPPQDVMSSQETNLVGNLNHHSDCDHESTFLSTCVSCGSQTLGL